MGDRVAVMRKGELQQVDDPQALFDAPVNLFVASFIGSPQMNLLQATVERDGERLALALGDQRLPLPDEVTSGRPRSRPMPGATSRSASGRSTRRRRRWATRCGSRASSCSPSRSAPRASCTSSCRSRRSTPRRSSRWRTTPIPRSRATCTRRPRRRARRSSRASRAATAAARRACRDRGRPAQALPVRPRARRRDRRGTGPGAGGGMTRRERAAAIAAAARSWPPTSRRSPGSRGWRPTSSGDRARLARPWRCCGRTGACWPWSPRTRRRARAWRRARTFPGFALEDVDRPAAALAAALEAIGDDAELAVELHALPGDFVAALDGRDLRDVRGALGAARMVKDADELAAIRAAIALDRRRPGGRAGGAARGRERARAVDRDARRDGGGGGRAAAGAGRLRDGRADGGGRRAAGRAHRRRGRPAARRSRAPARRVLGRLLRDGRPGRAAGAARARRTPPPSRRSRPRRRRSGRARSPARSTRSPARRWSRTGASLTTPVMASG